MNLKKLQSTFKGEIDSSTATRDKYSHDASIFEIKPEVVVYPKDVADLETLVKFVNEERAAGNRTISLTARSAGTDMSGGAVNESIIVDFTRHLNHLKSVEGTKEGGFAITAPGVYYRDFETETLKHDLLLPSYPASKSLCAMGGIMSNNSGGEKSLMYGKTEKYLEEVSVVLRDGNQYHFGPLNESGLHMKMNQRDLEGDIYRGMVELLEKNKDLITEHRPTVSKNSSGYYLWNIWQQTETDNHGTQRIFNLAKLFCGAQGTLGFITEGKLNLVHVPKERSMLVIFLHDLAPLGSVVNTIMRYGPETFESFDDHTLSLAMKFLPAMLKKMKGNVVTLGLKFLPEAWMVLTGGMPKLILIAEFTSESKEEAKKKAWEAEAAIKREFNLKTHITRNEGESEKYWTVRRESFSLLRERVKNLHSAPFVDDFSVHPKDLPEFLPKLNSIFAKYPSLVYTIAGHAGDANFHIIPLMDLSKASERAIIPKLSDEVYDLVLAYNGSITAEHNDGIVRGPYLEKMYGHEMFALFKQVKHLFDPENIFNPHKKTDATKEYLVSHIMTHV